MAIRVLIVDDHSMVRQGLQMYFEGDPEVEIIGEARNGEEALRLAMNLCPQVVLMDLLMPIVDGFQAIRALRQTLPRAHIVAMTSVVEEVGVHRAIEAGAISYVLKDTRPDELREAVLAAAEGRVRFPAESAGRLMQDVVTPDVTPDLLEADARAMLTLLATGQSSSEIAETCHRTLSEVDDALNTALTSLNLAGRAQAVCTPPAKALCPRTSGPIWSDGNTLRITLFGCAQLKKEATCGRENQHPPFWRIETAPAGCPPQPRQIRGSHRSRPVIFR